MAFHCTQNKAQLCVTPGLCTPAQLHLEHFPLCSLSLMYPGLLLASRTHQALAHPRAFSCALPSALTPALCMHGGSHFSGPHSVSPPWRGFPLCLICDGFSYSRTSLFLFWNRSSHNFYFISWWLTGVCVCVCACACACSVCPPLSPAPLECRVLRAGLLMEKVPPKYEREGGSPQKAGCSSRHPSFP